MEFLLGLENLRMSLRDAGAVLSDAGTGLRDGVPFQITPNECLKMQKILKKLSKMAKIAEKRFIPLF